MLQEQLPAPSGPSVLSKGHPGVPERLAGCGRDPTGGGWLWGSSSAPGCLRGFKSELRAPERGGTAAPDRAAPLCWLPHLAQEMLRPQRSWAQVSTVELCLFSDLKTPTRKKKP